MPKEMIISVNGREKKIAIVDDGKVTEYYIERGEENAGIAGNIYKGKVQRVLPGMQSAFVSIGLERDAFLYVSDFFDEEEEIERIVMEKSQKTSPEEAKKAANEQIERARIDREKQMESVQELAEPLVGEGSEIATKERRPENPKDRKRRDGGRKRPNEASDAVVEVEVKDNELTPIPIEFDDSGFERVIDDSDTGEMFKDAYLQEAIVDQVRAVEFDLESSSDAEVGSLIGTVDTSATAFERIADEDEAPAGSSAKQGKKRPSAKKEPAAKTKKSAEKSPKEKKAPKATAKVSKAKTSRKKKVDDEGELENAEAGVKEKDDLAEMSVRRGNRGRRRGGRRKSVDDAELKDELSDFVEGETADVADGSATEGAVEKSAKAEVERKPAKQAEAKSVDENAEAVKADGDQTMADASTATESEKRPEPKNRDSRRDNTRDRQGQGRNRQKSRPNDRRDERSETNDRNERRERPQQPTISDLLREGQEVLVQIAKEPIARKGARITSHIALPGRYLVYMPTIEHLGVSRKIESSSERGRLRTLIQRIRQDADIPSGGFIVRTAGIGISEEDLKQDAKYLSRTWQDIKKRSEKSKSPALVHQDLDIVQRLLRDQMSEDFAAIRVDSEDEYQRIVEFVNRIQPRMVKRVKLYTRDEPILDAYGVQEEIDKALKPRVWLKSGGYLVINQTEALVAIDVNTGKFVGKGNARLEDTITRTNLEAVDEIARQIRLRDLGGIIVLDLIDMEDRRNRHKVSQALQEALSGDKSPTKVLSFNDFGLIIMTRKRVKQSLERTMCSICEYCEGSGWVKSPQTVCFEILAEAARLAKQLDDVRQTTLRVHPEVAKALRGSEREVFEELEAHLGNVDISSDVHIHQAQFDFAFI